MSVPFEVLGPGQKGRLVYQVLGKDGPIYNPQNIKYLGSPPTGDSGDALPLDSSSIAAGLSGINLLVSTGTLALSAATLKTVRRIEREVTAIRADIADLKATVENIARRVERIDIGVSELNLREAIRHVFRTALSENGIDLAQLVRIAADLDKFTESLPEDRSAWSLRFPMDIHDQLNSLFETLYNLRYLVATRHNLSVGGDPVRVVSNTESTEYLGDDPKKLASQFVMSSTAYGIGGMGVRAIADDIAEQFTWASRDIEGARYENLMQELLVETPFDVMLWRPQEMEEYIAPSNVEKVAAESVLKFKDALTGLVAKQLIEHNEKLGDGSLKYNQSVQLHNIAKLHPEDFLFIHAINDVQKILEAWLWHSDEGLLVRLQRELSGIERGYAEVFWPHLLEQTGPSGLHEITVAGMLPEPTEP